MNRFYKNYFMPNIYIMKFIVDEKNKVIFGWSAKSGCTHIKRIFWYLTTNNENHAVHCPEEYGDIPNDIHNYTVILVFRNPLERLVSGYLNKYCEYGEFRKMWSSKSITFEKFVNVLIKNDFSQIEEHHFTPQTSENFNKDKLYKSKCLMVYDLNKINYEIIEKLYDKKIPKPLIDYRGPHVNNKTNNLEKNVSSLEMSEYEYYKVAVKNFYNEDLLKKVTNYYCEDFKFCRLFNIHY